MKKNFINSIYDYLKIMITKGIIPIKILEKLDISNGRIPRYLAENSKTHSLKF
jgi:hypothetical protein